MIDSITSIALSRTTGVMPPKASHRARAFLNARAPQRRVDRRGAVRCRSRRHREQVHMVLRDHIGHVAQEAIAIPRLHADRAGIFPDGALLPPPLYQPLRVL